MVNLGAMYDAGIGVPQDNVEAHKWYSLAIAKLAGPTDATARDVAAANRKGLAARMTESELADAQQAATDWKPK
jgi:TPR repeat protein